MCFSKSLLHQQENHNNDFTKVELRGAFSFCKCWLFVKAEISIFLSNGKSKYIFSLFCVWFDKKDREIHPKNKRIKEQFLLWNLAAVKNDKKIKKCIQRPKDKRIVSSVESGSSEE